MNTKKKTLLFALLLSCGTLMAQTPGPFPIVTVQGFVVAGNTTNDTYEAIGWPVAYSQNNASHEVVAGLAQSQLERVVFDETADYGEGYTENGFSFAPTTPVGMYHDSIYEINGGTHNYDLLKVLNLHIYTYTCGEVVQDGDNNSYNSVMVAGYCWTKENLHTTHYVDGGAEVAKALVYNSERYPDETGNENTFGRLYTWYSAVNVPEGSTASPTPNPKGFIVGICPTGWHVPTEWEMRALNEIPTADIRSTELWVQPNSNTNSTGFTALPAGMYNSSVNRFEGLMSQTDFWTDGDKNTALVSTSNQTQDFATIQLLHHCDVSSKGERKGTDAVSVRCVKGK